MLETCGALAHTERALEVINRFATAALGTAWNIRETFFCGGETADETIRTLGAYINYVRIGDRRGGTDVIIGDGELPVRDFMNCAAFAELRRLHLHRPQQRDNRA